MIIGIIGSILVLIAYFINAKFGIKNEWYYILNALGSAGIAQECIFLNAVGPAILNCIWFLVSLFYIVKTVFEKAIYG